MTIEETEVGTATEAMVVPVARVPGSSRGRWLVALGVVGVAIGATVAAVLLLGARQTPEALRYVPGDAVAVAELRLDLPGDQLQKVGNLLAHFPGFADQSTLALKLDEAGDRLVELLTDGEVSYTRHLKPWLDGPAFAAIRGVGVAPPDAMPGVDIEPGVLAALVVATTDGTVECATAFEGRAITTEIHRGFTIERTVGLDLACTLDGRYALIGDLASVRAGIDARADGRGIDRDDRYRAARDALGGDQLGTMYISGEAVTRLAGDAVAVSPLVDLAQVPAWSIAGVRAEDDALILDSVAAPVPAATAAPSLLNLAPTHPSQLTRRVPEVAIAYAEVQGAGTGIVNALAMLRAEPSLAAALGELDQVLTAFGGAEQLVGWVDDAAIVVTNDGGDLVGDFSAGVLLLAPDEVTARARVDSYRSLLALAGLGGLLELDTTTIGDVEVTTVTLTESAGLPTTEPVQVRFAVMGRLVVVATTEALMAQLLGIDGEGSLAQSDHFSRAAARGLANARTTLYVSVDHAFFYTWDLLPPAERPALPADLRAYLEPIDAIHVSATDGVDGGRLRIVMTVTDPRQP